ncbi:MAG: hemolysin XhlA family protein [Alphaproteobacteria bacterium]|nr:hemolysin XhlA family protein [Alphaproteobacteria bacterium]
MSNAKLKQQIEAAKIALVHSAELATPAHNPQQPATVTQIDSPVNADRLAESNNLTDVAAMASAPQTQAQTQAQPQAQPQTQSQPQPSHQDPMPLSDFEILETRLQELETQIKNQQRDLHTLLQKLRDITAKSKPLAEPKKTKGVAKWVFGFLLFAGGLAAAYFTLGVDAIMQAGYSTIGQMVALIDMLSTQF